jgi:predicted DNA binding CopG/RHH family protein
VDDELLKALRDRADAAGRNYQTMIDEALREFLARSERRRSLAMSP